MHPANRYRNGHDFPALARFEPALAEHLIRTPDGRISLNFRSPAAVRLLNRALVRRDYGLAHWDIPAGNLVPPVPGRLDYVLTLGDLLGPAARGPGVSGLDVGTGPGLIYPLLGVGEFGWSFVATDISADSLRVARAVLKFNPHLGRRVTLRRQDAPGRIFRGVVGPDERFAFSVCNPPFYPSAAAATAATRRKWAKLTGDSADESRNFAGQPHELWTPGGEPAFLRRMATESAELGDRIGWFTTLVSQGGYLKTLRAQLGGLGAAEVRALPLEQGGKRRRVVAWRF